MNLRWFLSSDIRHLGEMRKQVRKLLNSQRDILSPPAVDAMEGALLESKVAMAGGATTEELKKQMDNLEAVATKWLKPYPNAGIRENIEVLLVALAVAMGIRTFFLQPFKIPTGSMQPTLFGITPSPDGRSHNDPNLVIPGTVARFFDYWIHGNSYYNLVAPENGELQAVKPPVKLLLFNLKEDYEFNGHWHTVWFPADDLFKRAGYNVDSYGQVIDPPHLKAGDPIARIKVLAGDHLFVDRISYNFRHPTRGEIIVFETDGIEHMAASQYGQFYIKRLVGLSNEKVQVGNDRHLIIDGKRLDAGTPHFENVYSFKPGDPPADSHYSGHLNQYSASQYGIDRERGNVAPYFPDETTVYQIPTNHLMVMGDNTVSSYDSRCWGDFSCTNVVGKYFFVYWPITSRFGWGLR